MRFGKLYAYLRQREPDCQVGYSISICRVNESMLKEAILERENVGAPPPVHEEIDPST